MSATTVENSWPVVALIRLLGWATSAPSRRVDRAQRALTAPQNGSYSTQTASQPETAAMRSVDFAAVPAARCSHLGCAGAVVAAPHGWAVCAEHLPSTITVS